MALHRITFNLSVICHLYWGEINRLFVKRQVFFYLDEIVLARNYLEIVKNVF